MRYRQIEAFRSIMITGTTIGASQMMSTTQPAISRLIADLECDIQIKLFDRHRGRLRPTPEAVRFYREIEKFFVGIERLETAANQIRNQKPDDLKLCLTPVIATRFLPQTIKKFRKKYSAINILIESGSSSEVVGKLQSQTAHLGVTLRFPEVGGLVQESLITASHVCAVHKSHRLAQNDVVQATDLNGELILGILPSGLVNWRKVSQVLDGQNVCYQSDISIQNSQIGYSLVAADLAVAIIEPFAASNWLDQNVVTIPFLPKITYEYVLTHSATIQNTREIQYFSEVIKRVCAGYRSTNKNQTTD